MGTKTHENQQQKNTELFYRWKGLQMWALNLQVYFMKIARNPKIIRKIIKTIKTKVSLQYIFL